MKCPFCGSEDTQVVDTRANLEANTIRRRRKCVQCEKRFTTYERVDLKMPRLVKKDGSRTDFDREKLMGSMMLALRKRPVATEEVEGAVDRVIERLRSLGEREVSTSRVGDFVIRELAKLDKVAYIRFASVYRSFETPEDFRDALLEVKAAQEEAQVSDFSAFDHAMMRRALDLAERGLFTTTPNPRVGCVIDAGRRGRRRRLAREGRRAARRSARRCAQAGARAAGATAYVTLEPCNHHGRTPPCVDALKQAGVARVVAAMRDPNPQAARGGHALAAAGVRFESGLMEDEAKELNIGFVSRMTRGRPWVRLKIAATLDGRTALQNGKSQWITGPEARRDGHRWRARACAVLTGAGTVVADDPAPHGARGRDAAPAAARGGRQPARDAARRADPEGRQRAGVRRAAGRRWRTPRWWRCRTRGGKVDLPKMLAGAGAPRHQRAARRGRRRASTPRCCARAASTSC